MWTSRHAISLALLSVSTLLTVCAIATGAVAQGTDTTPPTITLLGANPVTQDCTGVYTDAGAIVTDDQDPAPTLTIDTSNVNPDSAGTYFVRYTARDASGNVRTATRTVIVQGTICDLGICDISGIAFGTTVSDSYLIPAVPGSVDVTLTAAVTFTGPCVPEVTYEVDGVVVGSSADAANGYPVAVNLAGGATYAITAMALDPGTGETATVAMTVEVAIGVEQYEEWDRDGNGYPDDLFETLYRFWGEWNAVVDSTNCQRVVAIRMGTSLFFDWRPPPPVTVTMVNPLNPAQVIDFVLPRDLLKPVHWWILTVAVSCDPESLLAPEDSMELTEDLPEFMSPVGLYVEISLLVSTDNGDSFAEIEPARVAANPIFVSLSDVQLTPGYRPIVLAHPTFFDSDPVLGAALLTEPGTWNGEAVQNTHYREGVLAFEIASLSAFGVFEEVPVPPTIEVTPSPAFTRVMGIVEVGASVNVTYVVKNVGSGVVNGAASIIGGDGAFSLTGATAYGLATNESQPITLRFAPRAARTYTATLRFSNGADAVTTTVQGAGTLNKAFNVLGCGAHAEAPGTAGADLAVLSCTAALLLSARVLGKRRGRRGE